MKGPKHGGLERQRQRIREALLAEPMRSNRSVAVEVGCHHITVGRVREELAGLVAAGEYPPEKAPPHPGHQVTAPEANNLRALKHGCRSDRLLAPRAEELAAELRQVVPGHQVADDTLIKVLALVLARVERANEWIDERGLFRNDKGDPQPVLAMLSRWENTAIRLCDQLGLSPMSRAKIGLVKEGEDGYAAFLKAVQEAGDG